MPESRECQAGDERLPPRFWAKVEVRANGCWVWTGARSGCKGGTRDDQYGYIRVDGKALRAHRFAYEALVGPIPTGLQLDHLCRFRPCVNPAHLEPVTNRENGLRGESPAAQAARKTHCPQGHPYDATNTASYRGKRYCKTCNREKAARAYARRTGRA